jgi:hypothetical protein
MATIPKSAKLNIEDFADAPKEMQPTLQKISTVLNPFLGDVKRGLEGKLTPAENLVFAEKVVTVRTPAHVYTAPTFLNSWVNFDTATYNAAGYRIDDDGRVWLRGLVKDGLWAGNAMFRLPVGYRPAKQLGFICEAGSTLGCLRVTAAGDVLAQSTLAATPTYAFLDAVYFEATTPVLPPDFVGAGWPITITPGLPSPVKHIELVQAKDTATGAYVSGVPVWALDQSGNVVIRRIKNLTPERNYELTVHLYG